MAPGQGTRVKTVLDELGRRGWDVRRNDGVGPLLPPELTSRYPGVPSSLPALLASVELCARGDGQSWFFTAADYRGSSTSAFAWDEVEWMSRDAARGDEAALREISRFWDAHLPFMLATHSDYDFLAVRLADGAVVHGYGPEWEEVTVVASTFDDFLDRLRRHLAGTPEPPLDVFFGAG